MSNNIFPEIICLDDKWFLRYISGGEIVKEIELPAIGIDQLWNALAMLLSIYVDDCGANLDRCIDFYNQAKNIFAGASQLCSDYAAQVQEQINLNKLYAPDENEPYWNK